MNLIDESTYRAETIKIVQDVLAMMLGYTAESAAMDETAIPHGSVAASVSFQGAWRGAAVLECDESTSRALCARLMKIPEPAQVDDDTLDAMGELINMLGGNLKSVLPGGVVLSPPSITRGPLQNPVGHSENPSAVFHFICEAGPFSVTLLQQFFSRE